MIYVDSNEKEKTFKELYIKYYDSIYNYIYHRVLNKESSEDIVSNVFFNVLTSIKKKKLKIQNFHAWIYKIATNEIIQFKKKNKKISHLSLDDEMLQIKKISSENNKINDNNIDLNLLKEELIKLKDIERTLLTLHFFENKNYSEISKILNIKENTLRPMMSRILKKLYNKLKFKLI